MAFERTKHFLDTFGQPRPARPRLIPEPYRIPFYIALVIVSLLALFALVKFVVIPGIEAYSQSGASWTPVATSLERTS